MFRSGVQHPQFADECAGRRSVFPSRFRPAVPAAECVSRVGLACNFFRRRLAFDQRAERKIIVRSRRTSERGYLLVVARTWFDLCARGGRIPWGSCRDPKWRRKAVHCRTRFGPGIVRPARPDLIRGRERSDFFHAGKSVGDQVVREKKSKTGRLRGHRRYRVFKITRRKTTSFQCRTD